MIGDGYCDDRFNLPIQGCPFDGGDCCGLTVNTLFCTHCICLENVTYGADCRHQSSKGNGVCNDFANTKECDYDGGDCCLEGGNYDYCADCECILGSTSDSLQKLKEKGLDMESKCPIAHLDLLGDGFCNQELNNKDCEFDRGDCSGTGTENKKCAKDNPPNNKCDDEFNSPECLWDNGECCGKADLTYCEECLCKDPANKERREITKCAFPVFKGNGKCDDANNIPECEWDGGDCCSCFVEQGFCTECACLDPSMKDFEQSQEWCCQVDKMNDGNCDNDNNNLACSYDGLDCCQEDGEFTCPLQTFCDMTLLKNGKCDLIYNTSACLYDFGSCIESNEESVLCTKSLYGDKICDFENFKPQCNFDGGDCQGGSETPFYVFFGGGITSNPMSDFSALSMNGKVSNVLPALPKAMIGASYTDLKGQSPLLCGGELEDSTFVNACFYLEGIENRTQGSEYLWHKLPTFSEARKQLGVNLINGHIWVTGGITAFTDEDGSISEQITRTTELYSFDTRQWERSLALDAPKAAHCLIAVRDNEVIVAGGYTDGGTILRTTYSYVMDPQTGVISSRQVGLLNDGRKFHTCGKFKTRLGEDAGFAVGGIGYDFNLDEVELVTAEMYIADVGEWVPIQRLPKPLSQSAAAVVSGRIVLLGGQSSEIRQSTVFVHNHQTGWHQANFQLPTGRYSHVAFPIEMFNGTELDNNLVSGKSYLF